MHVFLHVVGVGDDGEWAAADDHRGAVAFGAGLGDESHEGLGGHGGAEALQFLPGARDQRVVACIGGGDAAVRLVDGCAVRETRLHPAAARPELFTDGVSETRQFSSYENFFVVGL